MLPFALSHKRPAADLEDKGRPLASAPKRVKVSDAPTVTASIAVADGAVSAELDDQAESETGLFEYTVRPAPAASDGPGIYRCLPVLIPLFFFTDSNG
jgi:hypothetical protein